MLCRLTGISMSTSTLPDDIPLGLQIVGLAEVIKGQSHVIVQNVEVDNWPEDFKQACRNFIAEKIEYREAALRGTSPKFIKAQEKYLTAQKRFAQAQVNLITVNNVYGEKQHA